VPTYEHRPVAQLQHISSGRARARVHKRERTPTHMEQVKRRLEAHPGVKHVEVNAKTGSVLVKGDRDDQIQHALDDALNLVKGFEEGEPSDQAINAVVELVKDADSKVRHLTAGRISLRWLAPAAFVGVGLRQLIAEGLTLGTVPWFVLIYYGVDSFLKLYPHHAPHREGELQRIHGMPPA